MVGNNSQKRSEIQRAYIPFSTKERGLGLQGTILCGEVTRKYVGEQMEDKGYCSKVWCVQTHLGASSPSSVTRVVLLTLAPEWWDIYTTLTMVNLHRAFS